MKSYSIILLLILYSFAAKAIGPITGNASVCVGATSTLSDTTIGGYWISSNTAVGVIGSASGVVTGVMAGTTTITYTDGIGIATRVVTVNPLPNPILGPATICEGTNAAFTDSTALGRWYSLNTFVITIDSVTGVARGITADTATLIYRLSTGCRATALITVNPSAPITGPGSMCIGSTSPYANINSGGTWSSSSLAIATVGISTGIATGISAGVVALTYMLPTGCSSTITVSVNPTPAPITGYAGMCVGNYTALTTTTPGGSWSSANPAIGTVGLLTGIVTGISAGTANIYYTLSTGCRAARTVTVSPLAVLSGPSHLCMGSSISINPSIGGGVWYTPSSTITVSGSTAVLVTGISSGVGIVSYTLGTGCITTKAVTVNLTPAAISGAAGVCIGNSTLLTDTTTGGYWTTSSPSIAALTIGSTSGLVAGMSVGTASISYTLPNSCFSQITLTVNPIPAAITGATSVCVGSNITLSNTSLGGNWSSSDISVATVGGTGILTAISAGVVIITYSLPTGCYSIIAIACNPVASISGGTGVCTGTPTTFVPSVTGGVWSSSNTGVAVIGSSSGVCTGLAPGVSLLSYILPSGCITTTSVTVNVTPAPITGTSSLCIGASATLTDATSGGTWTSSSPATASVGYTTGIVAGLTIGSTTITYAIGSSCYVIATINVNAMPSPISGLSSICVASPVNYSNSISGGLWVSENPLVASIDPATGEATGIAAGTTNLSYILTSGCFVTKTVLVNPIPTIFRTTGGGSYCAGGSGMRIGLDGTTVGEQYKLYRGATPSSFWVSGTGAAIDFGSRTIPGTYTIVANIPATGCSTLMTGSATITRMPLPDIDTVSSPGGGGYCIGAPGANILLSNSDTGIDYTLYNGSTTIGTFAGIGSLLDFGAYTPGVYTVIATNRTSGCAATMYGSATIFTNALPTVFSVSGGGAYCFGGAGAPIFLSSSNTGISYQVKIDGVNYGAPTPGTGSSLTLGAFITPGLATVEATNTTTGCNATMLGSTVISITPGPGIITGTTSICQGATSTLTNTISGGVWSSGSPAVATIGSSTGILSGVSAGTASITYSIGTGCNRSAIVNINPLPIAWTVTGGGNYCSGGTGRVVGLSYSTLGINYQLYRDGIPVSIPRTGTGVALAFGTFTSTGSYTVVGSNTTTGCITSMAGSAIINVNSLPSVYSITGGGRYCSGGTGLPIDLDNSSAGIEYLLYKGSTAIGSAIPGSTGTPIHFGTHTDSGYYKVKARNVVTGCESMMADSVAIIIDPFVTPAVSISTLPGDTVCSGQYVTYTAIPVNGGSVPRYTWKKNGVAVSSGTTFADYPTDQETIEVTLVSNAACAMPDTVRDTTTMNVLAPGVITGSGYICVNAIKTLIDTAVGGLWYSSNSRIASISTIGGTSGVVTGVAAGTVTITYSLGYGCNAYTTVTVVGLPTVTATSSLADCGGYYTVSASGASSYNWSPSTGVVCTSCSSTIIYPSATTTYSVAGTDPGTGCAGIATQVLQGNRVAGHITFNGPTPDSTDLKVWLIQYDPLDSSLIAIDSTISCKDGGRAYYEFDNTPNGNYFVKAKLLYGNQPGSSGYIPTYGYSNTHWDSATTVIHNGATEILDINMIYGIVPPGSGFMGGHISSGAGKGTSGDIPVADMLVYLKDANNKILTYTYTNAGGDYSFRNIGYGSYIVCPEEYAYKTTAHPVTVISESKPGNNMLGFKQYTTSRIIRPLMPTGLSTMEPNGRIRIFPNPATNKLTIETEQKSNQLITVILTDISGKQILNTKIHENESIDISTVPIGWYQINIVSSELFHVEKLEIVH